MTDVRIDRVVTSGTFTLDGQSFDVDNNVWVVGDDEDVVVIDAAHDADAIMEAVGDREVLMIVCTHGHNDHINVAVELAERADAPVAMHADDAALWDEVHPRAIVDVELEDGGQIAVGDVTLRVIHTPGHSWGGISLHSPELGVVFTGDTLFSGGPGATGRSYSDFPTILESIRTRLFVLPHDTRVLTGHGDETTIGAEHPSYDEWVARGH